MSGFPELLPWTGVGFVPTTHHDTYPAIDPAKANLAGKVVAITGASKGIGKSVAVAFAQAGVSGLVLMARSNMDSVVATCHSAARAGSKLKIECISVDVSDPAGISEAVEKAKATFRRVDILVNNAGVFEPICPMLDLDPAVWWKTWEVNVRGTYTVSRAFLPLMIECGGDKTIINLTSIAAHFVVNVNAYCMSKLAVMRFTELLVAEYGSQGVVSFAVHPGSIATDMGDMLPEPMKVTLVDTIEIASHSIVWLAGERREWLSGRYFACQWDVDELTAKKQEIVDGDKLKMRMVV